MRGLAREELIRSYVHGGRDRRRLLLMAMVRPTRSILSGDGDPTERALKASELLSVLDRLDSAMGPDEPREPADQASGLLGSEDGFPLTFDDWRSLLRQAVDDAVSQDPGLADLLPVAEVMES